MSLLKEISITELSNLRIGHTSDHDAKTGVTVLYFPNGAKAGCDISGGGPASRETPLTSPVTADNPINAIVLSGGSAYGLAAADGVMNYLESQNIGYNTGAALVPLVCQSCIYDLSYGAKLFQGGDIWIYFKNTMIMWVMGFIPQILVSLLLAAWFSNPSLRLKGQRFFKTVIYLPNLIMASAFAMLFFTLFADGGPINAMLMQSGILKQAYSFFSHAWSARTLVAVLNFLMWFGNTTILLMAGMMGIDSSLYEAAEVDGATSSQLSQPDRSIFSVR